MKKITLALVICLAPAAFAQWVDLSSGARCATGRYNRFCTPVALTSVPLPPAVWWQLAPDSTGDGGTVTAPAEPCAAMAAAQWFDGGGNYFCQRGDAGTWPGPLATTKVGSPTLLSQIRPPFTPNGEQFTFQRDISGDGFKTTATETSYTGNFTVYGFVRASTSTGSQYLNTKWTTGSSVTLQYTLQVDANQSLTFFVAKAGGTFSSLTTAAGVMPVGTWVFVVASYKFVSDGTSEMRIYVSGDKFATKTNAVGPPQGLAIVHAFGSLGLFAGATSAVDVGAWGATEKWVSDADVAAMNQTIWGGALTFDDGRTVTIVAPNTRTCQFGKNFAFVPPNVPCVANVGGEYGTFDNELASWNFSRFPFKMDGAGWAKTSDCTVSCSDSILDYPEALHGCCNVACLDGGYVEFASGVTLDAGFATASIYGFHKVASTAEATMAMYNATTDAGICSQTLPVPNLDAGVQRWQCTGTITSGQDYKIRVQPNSALDFFCMNQLEPGKAATSFIPIEVGAARGATYYTTNSVSPTAAIPDAGCATLCMVPSWTGANALDTQFLATGSALLFSASGGQDNVYIADPGTNSATPGTGFAIAGAPRCAVATWSNGSYTINDFAATGTNVNGSGLGAFTGGLGLGNDKLATFRNARARLYDVRIANQTSACAPGAKLAALGDSKTSGPLGAASAPTPFLQGLFGLRAGGTWAYNFGVPSGGDTATITTKWQQNVQGRGYRFVTLENGYHDINDHASDGPTTLALWTTLADSIRADGSTLIPITVSCFHDSGAWTPTKQTALDYLNAGIRTYATAHSLQIWDSYNDPCLCNGNAMWPSRSVDGLHYTAEAAAKCHAPGIYAAARAAGAP